MTHIYDLKDHLILLILNTLEVDLDGSLSGIRATSKRMKGLCDWCVQTISLREADEVRWPDATMDDARVTALLEPLVNLRVLYVDPSCCFNTLAPLSNCKNLEELVLWCTRFKDLGPLRACQALQRVDVSYSDFRGPSPLDSRVEVYDERYE
jgi:hypothetical protein